MKLYDTLQFHTNNITYGQQYICIYMAEYDICHIFGNLIDCSCKCITNFQNTVTWGS